MRAPLCPRHLACKAQAAERKAAERGVDLSCAVLFLPGLLLSLSAGAIFGLAVGCIVVFAGAVLGETGAFVLGRYGPRCPVALNACDF